MDIVRAFHRPFRLTRSGWASTFGSRWPHSGLASAATYPRIRKAAAIQGSTSVTIHRWAFGPASMPRESGASCE